MSFSREDRTKASAGADKTVRLWGLKSGDLNFDVYHLVGRSYDWRRDYLQNNPHLPNSDRYLGDGTSSQK